MSKIRPQTPWVGVVRWGGSSLDTDAAAMKWASDAVETWHGLGRGSGRAALRRWRMEGGSRVPGPGRTTFPQTPGSEPRDAGAAPPWRAETPSALSLRSCVHLASVISPSVCHAYCHPLWGGHVAPWNKAAGPGLTYYPSLSFWVTSDKFTSESLSFLISKMRIISSLQNCEERILMYVVEGNAWYTTCRINDTDTRTCHRIHARGLRMRLCTCLIPTLGRAPHPAADKLPNHRFGQDLCRKQGKGNKHPLKSDHSCFLLNAVFLSHLGTIY